MVFVTSGERPLQSERPIGPAHAVAAIAAFLAYVRGTRRPMARLAPDPSRIRSFRDVKAFETWLSANHDRETELWVRMYRKGSGVATVTTAEALEVVLCWGWIDGIRKSFDESSYLQRYTPRRAKSMWSRINREHVARLVAAGRMTVHGQRQVDAAKADGRWEAAYAPVRDVNQATIPVDLRAAIEANPRARRTFRALGKMNLFALAFRTNQMKTAAGRARKIAALVSMLARGETIVPERRRVSSYSPGDAGPAPATPGPRPAPSRRASRPGRASRRRGSPARSRPRPG